LNIITILFIQFGELYRNIMIGVVSWEAAKSCPRGGPSREVGLFLFIHQSYIEILYRESYKILYNKKL